MANNEVVKVFSLDIPSATTLSSALDLSQGWSEVSLKIPQFASASNIYIHASESATGDYVRVMFPPINSATVATNDFTIVSGISARIIPIPSNYQHIKVELSTMQSDATSVFNVIYKS